MIAEATAVVVGECGFAYECKDDAVIADAVKRQRRELLYWAFCVAVEVRRGYTAQPDFFQDAHHQ